MIHRTFPFLLVGTVVFATVADVSPLRAQFSSPAAVVAPSAFDYDLGSRTMDGATYSVKSTQPADSKLKSQRVRFTSVAPTGAGTTTRYFTINTGKYKTVG